MKTMKWEVTIAEVENGYVVRVGCKLFVFPGWESLYAQLYAYAHGEKTELAEQVLKDMPTGPEEACQPEQPAGGGIANSLARG